MKTQVQSTSKYITISPRGFANETLTIKCCSLRQADAVRAFIPHEWASKKHDRKNVLSVKNVEITEGMTAGDLTYLGEWLTMSF